MERIELFKAATKKTAEVMELFPDLMADVFTYPDRISVCYDYKDMMRHTTLYCNEGEHEAALHNLVAEAVAMVVGDLQKELEAVKDERDVLAAKLDVMESQQKGGSDEA